MSKGQIIESLGDGLYRIKQMKAVESIEKEIEALNLQLSDTGQELLEAQVAANDVESQILDIQHQVELLISDYSDGLEGSREAITSLQAELIPLQSRARQLALTIASIKADRLSMLKRKRSLESIPDGEEMIVWCADYSDDLAGEVGLVDINDEGGQRVLIKPAYESGAEYSRKYDGALFPSIAQSGAQLFFNLAILPGVQKWLPQHRTGTISNVRVDSCTVHLDPATSSAQGLDINNDTVLHDVPIYYMECDGLAFEDGDKVLLRRVREMDAVIGFAKAPKRCGSRLICTPMKSTDVWRATYYGEPFEEENGAQINPPLGTEVGTFSLSAWIFTPTLSAPRYRADRGISHQNYGYRNWIGERPGDLLSWHGPPSRICALDKELEGPDMINLYDFDSHAPYGTHVYYKNSLICNLKSIPQLGVYGSTPIVDGAAIVYKNGNRYLRVCGSNLTAGIYNQWTDAASFYKCRIVDLPWGGRLPDPESAEVVGEYNANYLSPATQGMYFSASGGKAVMCFARNFYQINVLRWSELGGFSEEGIVQGGGEPGVRTGTYTRDQTSAATFTTRTETWNGQVQEYSQTIGIEFDGETEIPVRIVHGHVDHDEERGYHRTFTYIDVGGDGGDEADYYRSVSANNSLSESVYIGPMRIMAGTEVICQTDGPGRVRDYRYNYTDSHSSNETLRRSGTESIEDTRHEFRKFPVIIDARIGTILIEHERIDRSQSTTHSGATGQANNSVLLDLSLRCYRWGAQLFAIDAEQASLVTTENYNHDNDEYRYGYNQLDAPTVHDQETLFWTPQYGNPGGYTSFWNINRPNTPLARNTRIRQASLAEANGNLMLAVEWFRRTSDTEHDLARITYMDHVANPVGQFINRDPDDGYMLGKVGLI